MDKINISRNARHILNTLGCNREWTYRELKEVTKLSDRELNTAIGWLAHEGSICIGHHCGESRLSLNINVYL